MNGGFRDKIGKIWDKVNLVIAIPMMLGFIVAVVFGQICFDNLPYLLC